MKKMLITDPRYIIRLENEHSFILSGYGMGKWRFGRSRKNRNNGLWYEFIITVITVPGLMIQNCYNFGYYAGGYTFHATGIEGGQKSI